jgi:phosphotransferase system HPr-like phosphotransfer protein
MGKFCQTWQKKVKIELINKKAVNGKSMYSIIDIESNGAGYRNECIIDIAIYRYDGQKITDQFISLVNRKVILLLLCRN